MNYPKNKVVNQYRENFVKCLDIRTRYMIGIGVTIIATIAYGLIDFYRVKSIISISYGD